MTKTVIFLQEELRDRQAALVINIDQHGWLCDQVYDINNEIDVVVKLLKKARGE